MVKTVKLDSGVRLVMEKIDYVRSVAIGIWVKAGACDEDKANAGISHYIEHMMFKGTANRTAREIAADIDKIGGQINAFTGKEATCYYVKSTSEHYRESADVLVDMLTNTLLDPKDMKRERNVIREEIKMNADDPDDLAHETVTRDSIVISVAGYFDEMEVTEYFNDKLLTLTAEKEPKKVEIPEYKPGYRCITKDIEQTHICMATKAISLYDDRYYALSILSNIMGGSMSSRLFQNIREEKGLAYSVYSMNGLFSGDGYFNIYAGVSHDKVQKAIGAVVEELDILEKSGVTEEELDSSREQMKAGNIFSMENVSGRMFKNGKNTLLSGRVFTEDEVMKGFDGVTLDDIDGIKELICKPENYSVAVVTRNSVNVMKMMRG